MTSPPGGAGKLVAGKSAEDATVNDIAQGISCESFAPGISIERFRWYSPGHNGSLGTQTLTVPASANAIGWSS